MGTQIERQAFLNLNLWSPYSTVSVQKWFGCRAQYCFYLEYSCLLYTAYTQYAQFILYNPHPQNVLVQDRFFFMENKLKFKKLSKKIHSFCFILLGKLTYFLSFKKRQEKKWKIIQPEAIYLHKIGQVYDIVLIYSLFVYLYIRSYITFETLDRFASIFNLNF